MRIIVTGGLEVHHHGHHQYAARREGSDTDLRQFCTMSQALAWCNLQARPHKRAHLTKYWTGGIFLTCTDGLYDQHMMRGWTEPLPGEPVVCYGRWSDVCVSLGLAQGSKSTETDLAAFHATMPPDHRVRLLGMDMLQIMPWTATLGPGPAWYRDALPMTFHAAKE